MQPLACYHTSKAINEQENYATMHKSCHRNFQQISNAKMRKKVGSALHTYRPQIKIHKIPDLGSSFYIIMKTGVLTLTDSGFENNGTYETTKRVYTT